MTQEQKQLFLKDLCSRLPYGVKANIGATNPDVFDDYIPSTVDATLASIDLDTLKCRFKEFWWYKYVTAVRPYLRPMSNMTNDEQKEFVDFHCVNICPIVIQDCLTVENESKMLDWLNEKMFDYRGLIPMSLALEAPEGMYKMEE